MEQTNRQKLQLQLVNAHYFVNSNVETGLSPRITCYIECLLVIIETLNKVLESVAVFGTHENVPDPWVVAKVISLRYVLASVNFKL